MYPTIYVKVLLLWTAETEDCQMTKKANYRWSYTVGLILLLLKFDFKDFRGER